MSKSITNTVTVVCETKGITNNYENSIKKVKFFQCFSKDNKS